jgi:hypothetical protein
MGSCDQDLLRTFAFTFKGIQRLTGSYLQEIHNTTHTHTHTHTHGAAMEDKTAEHSNPCSANQTAWVQISALPFIRYAASSK